MGFLDFLKGIIPEKFIYVDNRKIDNRKIEITNSSIHIGDETINDPALVDKVFEKIAEYKQQESLPCQIIHKDLSEGYIDYENLSIVQSESIKKLKQVLPNEEVECILMARRIKLAYDKKDAELARKLYKKLLENYPVKGNKIYNLVGGGYFDEMLIPFIDLFKSQHEDKYIEEYRRFYFDILKFFPLAYFIGNGTTKDQIKHELTERLKLTVPFIRLHAIGESNIKKIEETISEMGLEETYSIKDYRFNSPIGLKGQILEIKVTKDKK